jgi:hypothetical protein
MPKSFQYFYAGAAAEEEAAEAEATDAEGAAANGRPGIARNVTVFPNSPARNSTIKNSDHSGIVHDHNELKSSSVIP